MESKPILGWGRRQILMSGFRNKPPKRLYPLLGYNTLMKIPRIKQLFRLFTGMPRP